MLEPGQQVDEYRLERTIDRGSGTTVFAATEIGTGRAVAVKVLAGRYASDAAVRQRFLDEAAVATRLDGHPNIAAVYAWGQVGDAMYFVTELVDGISLAELSRRADGPVLSDADALDLLEQIGGALDFAHKRGAVHRDVRPANVMVSMTSVPRQAYLVDFGITKTTDRDRPGVTGVFIGTADYASPEQIAGAARIDGRADVYSLACVAFELLTGRPPYGGAANDAARIAAHLQAPVPRATAVRPTLPAAVDDVFDRGLAKQPAARYGRGGDLVKDLRDALSGPAAAAGPSSLLRPVPPPAPSRRAWIGAAAAVAVALVLAAVFLVVRRGGVSGDVGPAPGPTTLAPAVRAAPETVAPSTSPTSTTAATTTVAPTTSAPATTVATGLFGYPVGAAVAAATQAEAAFALDVQRRANPLGHSPVGSPAMLYAQWVRLVAPSPSDAVTATAEGFEVSADRRVELRDFQRAGGQVSSFTECSTAGCIPLAGVVTTPADPGCEPGTGCPHVRSQSGAVTAYQRATLLLRWPAQILFYELVVDPSASRTLIAVDEPDGTVHYDAETGYLVATFDDRPEPGTRHQLTLTFDDGSTDTMTIYYG